MMQEEVGKLSRSRIAALAALIVVVCAVVIVVHWPALSARAVSWDDEQYLSENILVQNPSWKSAWRFLTEALEPSTVGGYYQPLAMISLMLDYALGGRVDNVEPFHRTSLAIHAVNTALVIVLLYILFDSAWIAAAVGLLFGVHPMTVEPIPWVSERKTLVASFFAFWCLILYVRYARKGGWKFYLACIMTYLLALMSKPTSTPLPVMMLLMDYWPLKRLKWRTVLEKIPFLVIGVILGVITYISQSRTAGVTLPGEHGPAKIVLTFCHNVVFYPYKIIWPVKLSSCYPFPEPMTLSDPMVLAGVIGTCILIPVLVISLRWTRAMVTGWLIFFITILPTMQIVGFSNVIASDKFAYLPSIGLLMVLAAFLCWFCSRGKVVLRSIVVVIIVLILTCAEGIATQRYLAQWRTMMTLCKYMLALDPDAAQVHNMAGNAFQSAGRLDEALSYYSRAVHLAPSYADARNNLGTVLKLQGRYIEAANCYQQALQIEPNNPNIRYNFANVLQTQSRLDEAINQYYQVLRIRPEHVKAHNNLANALASQGKFDEAISHYRRILQIMPQDAIAYNNIGSSLEEQGKRDEAIDYYGQALRINPDFPEANYNLINAFASQGKLDEVLSYYRQTLQVKLDDAEMYNLFGVSLASKARFDEAVNQFKRALQVKPDFADAHFNLGRAFAAQDKFSEAIDQYRQALLLAPQNAEIHYNTGLTLAMMDQPAESLKHFQEAMRLKPDWSMPLVWMARVLATYPDPNVHDANSAVGYAQRAAELTKYQDAEVLETLAAAYAAAGHLQKAVTTAETALALALTFEDKELANQIRERLQSYKQTKP